MRSLTAFAALFAAFGALPAFAQVVLPEGDVRGFYRGIADTPTDGLPRLVFGDYLADHNATAWEAFLRRQVAMTEQSGVEASELPAQTVSELNAMFEAAANETRGASAFLPADLKPFVSSFRDYDRGIPSTLHIDAGNAKRPLPVLFKSDWSTIKELVLDGFRIQNGMAPRIVEAAGAARLRTLRILDLQHPATYETLARLPSVESLHVSYRFGARSLAVLGLPSLRHLSLDKGTSVIPAEELRQAFSPALKGRLETFHLSGSLSQDIIDVLSAAGGMPKLQTLSFGQTLNAGAIERLQQMYASGAWPFPQLREMTVSVGNYYGDGLARLIELQNASFLKTLKVLRVDLSWSYSGQVTEQDVRRFLASADLDPAARVEIYLETARESLNFAGTVDELRRGGAMTRGVRPLECAVTSREEAGTAHWRALPE
jgi:uncharacterized protein (TIGR02996 family)